MWDKAASEIMRAIRGSQSQRMLARRLGYKGNPVRDWEAGRRFPTATEAFRAAQLGNIHVHGAFVRFHDKSAHHLTHLDKDSLAHWLSDIRGTTQISELAARAGQSRYSISRWLKGNSRPRLPDFLQLVDAITGRASDLVAELVPIEQVTALATLHHQRSTAKDLAFVEPWTEAVMRLLETQSYLALPAHDVNWIASKLDVDPATVEQCIRQMLDAGVLRPEGLKLRASSPLTIYTGADKKKAMSLKRHWAQVGHQRMEQHKGDDWFSYNVMSLSSKDLQTVRELMKNTFQEIRSIVAASTPEETVALVQMQLIDWEIS